MLTPLLMLGNNNVWHHDIRYYVLRLHMTGIGVPGCLMPRCLVPGCLVASLARSGYCTCNAVELWPKTNAVELWSKIATGDRGAAFAHTQDHTDDYPSCLSKH
jgi:hypothetical protein